jgi:DNA-binding response OmpR family regulator
MRIAVLDDDPTQLDLVSQSLARMGHDARTFPRAEVLLRQLRRETFDLLIVDWQLPDLSGPEVVRWVRAHVEHPIPILFITNRGEEADVMTGLASGADDYMVKPLRVGELTARVHALLRRSYPGQAEPVQEHGGYRFDLHQRTLSYRGEPIELKPKEWQLALVFFQHVGRLLSRNHLLDTVWGLNSEVSSRTLDTHVSHLRNKLQLRPSRGFRLVSVYGVGYRLEAVETSKAET